jgi:hypothetical protein
MGRLSAVLALSLTASASVSLADQPSHSPYAGQEQREIKSLSADDIGELRRGGGWGMAKAAELNGYPGPVHLLDLQVEIGLSSEQIAAITVIYEKMKRNAIPLGEEMIRGERALEESFLRGAADEKTLAEALDGIARVRRDLRFTHLAAHLKVKPLLTEQQTTAYWTLRGYDTPDLCRNPPAGHDPAMWRKHNNCP